MTTRLLATHANDGRYLELIKSAYERTKPEHICAAVAYATHSGVADLHDVLSSLPGWRSAKKQWLIGIDYCRSDPLALAHLSGLPKSHVRIFDGGFVATRSGCVPRYSFHPKAYLLFGSSKSAAVVGSGNLSRTGLQFGVEAAAAVRNNSAIADMKTWFRDQWRSATPLQDVKVRYQGQYESAANRSHPQVSEDDALPESATKGAQLKPHELRKLRVCRHLWIEAGKVTPNRGPKLPGNQLMMKRNTCVFFGFPATDRPQNSAIGVVTIELGGQRTQGRPLRFSHNSMDVLTLPILEEGEAYSQETLHFEQIGVRVFRLTIGSRHEIRLWKKRSKTIEGTFQMKGGRRQWGVY